MKNYESVSRPPSRPLTLIAFGAAGNVSPTSCSRRLHVLKSLQCCRCGCPVIWCLGV